MYAEKASKLIKHTENSKENLTNRKQKNPVIINWYLNGTPQISLKIQGKPYQNPSVTDKKDFHGVVKDPEQSNIT